MGYLEFEGYQLYLGERSEENAKLKTIELKCIQENESWDSKEPENRLIFQIRGEMLISSPAEDSCILLEKEFVFIPSNKKISIHIRKTTDLIIFRIDKQISLRQYFRLQEHHIKYVESELYALQCTDLLFGYLNQLKRYMDQDLNNCYYQNLKLDELLLSFGWFYSKEELARLFSSQLNQDCGFSSYIINNGYKYHTIGELAKDLNYSVSGFDKKFKRVFGVSGYKWLKTQKAKRVLQSIYSDDLSFKEIADNFDFSSESYFYEFCKTEFGKTPGQIRKSKNPELMAAHE